jgi:hypothetical protein
MNSGHPKSEAVTTGSPAFMLEIAGIEGNTPHLMPVLIQNLSMGGVTLAVTNPGGITDWDRYRGRDCVLRVGGSGSQEVININAKISWSKYGGIGQPPMFLGLQMARPPGEALKRLSIYLAHTSQDTKGLWDRYDQVQETPASSYLVDRCYIIGLALLMGGLVLQFANSPPYQMFGWVLWFLGSLGIAGKVIRPFRQKRVSQRPDW